MLSDEDRELSAHLVMLQGLQGPAVPLGVVDTEGRQELEHLLLHLAAVGVQRWNWKCPLFYRQIQQIYLEINWN